MGEPPQPAGSSEMGNSHPSARRRRRCERGQAVTELAFILPLILVIVIGVIEVNNALNAYLTVVNAARDGARLGSKGGATTAQIQTLVVKDLARLQTTTPASNVSISYPVVSGTNSVRVQACYDHHTLLKVPLLIPSTFHMCSSTTMPKLN